MITECDIFRLIPFGCVFQVFFNFVSYFHQLFYINSPINWYFIPQTIAETCKIAVHIVDYMPQQYLPIFQLQLGNAQL